MNNLLSRPKASWSFLLACAKKYSIRKGTKVAFIEDDNRLILQPITNEFLQRIRGSLKGKPSALEFLLKTRREERDR